MAAQTLFAPSAEGFQLTRLNANRAIRITRSELAQDGVTLRRRREQTFSSGLSTADLVSFTTPLEFSIDGQAPVSMTASSNDDRFLRIRLNGAERAQCLTQADFQVDVAVGGPPTNTLTSADGGALQVFALDAVFDRARGRGCPRDLIYGYTLDLGVDDATSDDGYRGDIDITVTDSNGNVQVLATQIEVDMPSVLLLYHFAQIDINVLAAAMTELVAPAGGDLGTASVNLVSMALPVDADIASVAPPVSTLTPTVTLQNVVGARAIGCGGGIYAEASFDVSNTTGGILPSTGTINDIQGQPCNFNLVSGDVQVQLDLNAATFNGGTAQASAQIQVTITGL
ncbi:MAG: hypothetical protein O7C67_19810 [Gammaproteobacteria bacterium]|nr:hypothetical protein [Gammaproteobacteria bacterium]